MIFMVKWDHAFNTLEQCFQEKCLLSLLSLESSHHHHHHRHRRRRRREFSGIDSISGNPIHFLRARSLNEKINRSNREGILSIHQVTYLLWTWERFCIRLAGSCIQGENLFASFEKVFVKEKQPRVERSKEAGRAWCLEQPWNSPGANCFLQLLVEKTLNPLLNLPVLHFPYL